MLRAVMYDPWLDFSLYDGLAGYGRYWISRLRYQKPSSQARECLWHIVELIKINYRRFLRKNKQMYIVSYLTYKRYLVMRIVKIS